MFFSFDLAQSLNAVGAVCRGCAYVPASAPIRFSSKSLCMGVDVGVVWCGVCGLDGSGWGWMGGVWGCVWSQAFWPGLQVLYGEVAAGVLGALALGEMWVALGFLPEHVRRPSSSSSFSLSLLPSRLLPPRNEYTLEVRQNFFPKQLLS